MHSPPIENAFLQINSSNLSLTPNHHEMSLLENGSAAPAAGTAGHGEVQSPESYCDVSVSADAHVSKEHQALPASPMKDSTRSVEETSGSFSQAPQAAADAPHGPEENNFPWPLLEGHLAYPTKSEDLAINVSVGSHKVDALLPATSLLRRGSSQLLPLEDGPPSEPMGFPPAPTGLAPDAVDSPQSMKALIMKARKDPTKASSMIGVRKELAGVAVYKMPPKKEFHRVRPDRDPLLFNLLAIDPERGEREYYLVADEKLALDLSSDPYCSGSVGAYQLALVVNPQGVFGWWAVNLSAEHDWADSARAIRGKLESVWARVESGRGRYEMLVAEGDLGEPVWPDIDDETLLEKSFGKRFITSMNHPVLLKLRGKA
jgi:hypothetical protein